MIAREQAAIHDMEGAEESLEVTNTEKLKGIPVLLELKTEASDLESAVSLLAQIKKGADKGRALEMLTNAMTRAGKEEGARGLVNQQSAPAMKVYALLGILAAKVPADVTQE